MSLPATPDRDLEIYVGASMKRVISAKAKPITIRVNVSRREWDDQAARNLILEDVQDMIEAGLKLSE